VTVLATATPFDFVLVSARDLRVRLPRLVDEETGDPLDLTGAIVLWGAEPTGSPAGQADTLTLSSADGGIEILDQTDVDLRGFVDLVFTPAMTADLDNSVLDHEVYAIDVGGITHHGCFGAVTVVKDVA